jgi:hypothetical protein
MLAAEQSLPALVMLVAVDSPGPSGLVSRSVRTDLPVAIADVAEVSLTEPLCLLSWLSELS